jgi:UDP-N-acetyl-D-glucosamine dehydrogenase
MRHHNLQMESVKITPESLKAYDCVLISTNHSAYDWQMIADNARLVVDTRNAMRDVKGKKANVVKA